MDEFYKLDFRFWILKICLKKYVSRKLPQVKHCRNILSIFYSVFIKDLNIFSKIKKVRHFIQKLQNTKFILKKKDGQNFFNIVIFFFRKIIFVVI
jgi:hypothetical protein